jgi:hypothetical protein
MSPTLLVILGIMGPSVILGVLLLIMDYLKERRAAVK